MAGTTLTPICGIPDCHRLQPRIARVDPRCGESVPLRFLNRDSKAIRPAPTAVRSIEVPWVLELQPGRSRVFSSSSIEPVAQQRGEQFGPLMHERMAGVLDDSQGGVRVALEQFGRVGIPDDRIAPSRHH